MKRHRNTRAWLLSFLKAGELATLFLLPFTLVATAPPDQSPAAPPADPPAPPNPNAYEPEVVDLIETTYLGRGKEFPDPEEPTVVLKKYLEQNAHGYHAQLTQQEQKLDAELAEWQALTRQYPQSRHAFVALGKYYRTKAQASGDIAYTRQAADAYLEAADIGLSHGRILYTRELSELLVELGDRKGLDEIFGRMLAQPTDLDRDFYYLALVDYADGLARFSDDRAWGYFEQAIDLHPENNLEAINRYTQHLLSRRREQVQQALEVLDTRLTSEQRVRFVLPARLRKQAMEILGLDTTSADAEVATIEQRLSGGWGKAPTEERSSKVTGTEAPVVASFTLDSRIPTIFAPAVALAVTSDSRVSAIFAVLPDNTDTQKVDERTIQQDAIFNPNGAMNNRWTSLSPTTTAVKLATLKWPNSNRAGLVRLGTDNTVYYRYFNGASWGTWQSLGQTALDVAATAWPPGPADIYIVGLDGYIRQSHSPNGQPGSWGTWVSHACCASEVATAVTPGGLLYLAAQATTQSLGYAVWVTTTSNSSTYTPWINLGQAPGGQVKDLTLLAYNNVVGLAVVGANNCSLYQKHNNGGVWYASWFNYSSSPCFKNVSSFNTDDGGAYLVYIGTSTNALSTQRFTGGAWAGIVPQGTRTWIAAAGANIDDEAGNAYEHTEANDDCRVKHYSSGPVCDNYGNCFWTQGVNLAEIIYNEARAETLGAQDAVGWTVRDRAFEGLSNPSLCNSYPGAEAGGTLTADCRNPDTGVPCNQNGFCDNTPRYCCAMHGEQTQLGTSGYQFIDEHVDINTLVSSGVMDEAVWVGNGLVPDMSTGWCPPGVGNCYLNCAAPWSDGINFNFSDPSPHGPMEFRGFAYPVPNSSCQQAPTTNTCPGGAANSICCNASPNNYFWNRK